jgi:FkbM family methyltransferase
MALNMFSEVKSSKGFLKLVVQLKRSIKKIITFILAPLGSYKIIVYISILSFFHYLGLKRLSQKLLYSPNIDTLKFVKTSIKSTPGKYSYFTNSIDDLRYSCRSNFLEWEFVSRHFFVSIASDCEFILDIGAYTGVYSIEAAIINDKCTVNSFEPNPKIFQNLQKNIEVNKLEKRVKISQSALGKKNGTTRLYLPLDNNSTSIATLKTKTLKYFKVPISSLDYIFSSNCIDLIKIDVEGYESEVFLGGQNVLDEFKPIILAEALTQNELRNQQLILSKYGYKDPIQVSLDSKSDSRNYIWFSKKDEFKANSFLSKSRKEFIKKIS